MDGMITIIEAIHQGERGVLRASVSPAAVLEPLDRVRTQAGRFWPARPLRWAVLSVLAAAATLAIGVCIPLVLNPAARILFASLPTTPMAPWIPPLLWGCYVLFVVLVILPYLMFLAWSCAGVPPGASGLAGRWPSVSILIPAYNEQEIICDAIHAALNQDYPDFEVIVIDDGSTDLTAHLAMVMGVRLVRHERNRGKSAALNSGREAARGEVIVTCDADGYLDPSALRHLVGPLADPGVAAVAGQVRLFHPRGILRRLQLLEYDYGQGVIKRAQYASTGCVLVAPGPVSAYRADVLDELGGVPGDTLTEDFDLTMLVIGQGLRIAYEPRAIAYTDAPRTDSALRRQRLRWGRGGFQVLRKHRRLIGERSLGLLGLFWLPYSYMTWYAALPISALLTALLPVVVWGSGAPYRFLACLALYGLVGVGVELLKVVSGVFASDLRDWRYLAHAPLFLIYKKLRLDWFPAEALYHEWRDKPRIWHG